MKRMEWNNDKNGHRIRPRGQQKSRSETVARRIDFVDSSIPDALQGGGQDANLSNPFKNIKIRYSW